MAFVNDADVQKHLPVDRLPWEEVPDDKERIEEGVQRVIRGYLAGSVDSAVLATWISPTTTPDMVREIAGRLIAAQVYRLRFGQQSFDDPEYAQVLYNEAMAMLNDIISGAVEIPGVAANEFTNEFFEPNNASDPPRFTMADRY